MVLEVLSLGVESKFLVNDLNIIKIKVPRAKIIQAIMGMTFLVFLNRTTLLLSLLV